MAGPGCLTGPTPTASGCVLLRRLADAATAWDALGRDPGALYRGAQLEAVRVAFTGPEGERAAGLRHGRTRGGGAPPEAGPPGPDGGCRERPRTAPVMMVLLGAPGGGPATRAMLREDC
ncbi:hypothetical protein GCM10010232_67950 [Streptomyces amakusaensis]